MNGFSQTARRARRVRALGFTLIEVMVALAIVSIALVAGLKATTALVNNAQRQTDVLLARLCAENALIRTRLTPQMPGIGDSAEACEQGNRSLNLQTRVAPTPNPNFRRVDAEVYDGESLVLRISTVVGRY